MSDEIKQILMIASRRPTEALRMATGLTLLDDQVRVTVLGELEKNPANEEQMEALDFSDVPVTEIVDEASFDVLAQQLFEADVVYCI
jgi:hypothetical protein